MVGPSKIIIIITALKFLRVQVKEVYQRKNGAYMPDYIKGLANPNREKYYDSLVKLKPLVN